jgi:hypothetical protein
MASVRTVAAAASISRQVVIGRRSAARIVPQCRWVTPRWVRYQPVNSVISAGMGPRVADGRTRTEPSLDRVGLKALDAEGRVMADSATSNGRSMVSSSVTHVIMEPLVGNNC